MQTTIVRVLYRRSEGILLARKLRDLASNQDTRIETILALVESFSPPAGVVSDLPFYYRQLFLGKHAVKHEFWLRRTEERQRAERAIRRYRDGYHGAILITGEGLSGKSSFCRYLADTYFRQQKVYHIFAPDGGSADPHQFKRTLQAAMETTGDCEDIIQSVPSGSLVVFHDLELWWERSPHGFAVIDMLLAMIDRHSDRCLFLVNAQSHSFRFINRIKPIEQAFLDMIDCEPFDAKDLQTAILVRHRSGGFMFDLEGRSENQLSDFRLARLFTEYFDFSAGNIGVALHAWIGHIHTANGEHLMVHTPSRPDLSILEQMDSEWLVWLQQFVLHKHLTRQRLVNIFRHEADISTYYHALKRAGLTIESSKGVIELNPYIRPFVVQVLSKMEML